MEESPPQSESYGVQILVDGRPRPVHFVGKDAYVSLSRGDVYAIRVENRTGRRVYLRLLVDGLNTLPERVQSAGGSAEQSGQDAVYLSAQRVSLDKAQAWRLDARPKDAQAEANWIQGFYRSLGKEQYEWETFKVVDAPASLAYQHQQKYTEQIGLITAAFYEVPADKKPRCRSRGLGNLGTGRGEKRQGKLDEYEEKPVGRLLTVINIHYVEPEVLQKIQTEEAPPMP